MQHGMPTEGEDARFMRRALELALRAYGMTAPNPHVGAVVVHQGQVLGEGWHERAGLPHAEPRALEQAARRIDASDTSRRDLTLYVNVEPCTHQGRTPPCVEAILRAPVGRVVVAMQDPDPRVSGKGIQELRHQGVQVDVGCLQAEAEELNHAFVARQRRRRPFVALKVALSADDCIAGPGGVPVAITSERAQRHAHRVRAGCQAILAGVETVRRDHPRLDRRMYDGPGQVPRRLVFDPRLRSQPEWLQPGREPWLLFAEAAVLEESRDKVRALQGWAEVAALPLGTAGFDLEAFLAWLQEHRLWSVLVEGGGMTHRAFLRAGLWDRLYLYRNASLRLEGLAWSAREAWKAQRQDALIRRQESLGRNGLVVHDHRRSVLDAA